MSVGGSARPRLRSPSLPTVCLRPRVAAAGSVELAGLCGGVPATRRWNCHRHRGRPAGAHLQAGVRSTRMKPGFTSAPRLAHETASSKHRVGRYTARQTKHRRSSCTCLANHAESREEAASLPGGGSGRQQPREGQPSKRQEGTQVCGGQRVRAGVAASCAAWRGLSRATGCLSTSLPDAMYAPGGNNRSRSEPQ